MAPCCLPTFTKKNYNTSKFVTDTLPILVLRDNVRNYVSDFKTRPVLRTRSQRKTTAAAGRSEVSLMRRSAGPSIIGGLFFGAPAGSTRRELYGY
jgi:hypothetical protein